MWKENAPSPDWREGMYATEHSLHHWRRFVPVGKEVVEGEVERRRNDERNRLRRQRGHFEDQVQQA